MTLPAALQVIESEALQGSAAERIVIPEGVTTIGSGAFANCPNLRQLYFKGDPAQIAEDFLTGCGNVMIYAPHGSRTAQWATAKGYTVVCY